MKKHLPTVVYAAQGQGFLKTLTSKFEYAAHHNKTAIVDEWNGIKKLKSNQLAITNVAPPYKQKVTLVIAQRVEENQDESEPEAFDRTPTPDTMTAEQINWLLINLHEYASTGNTIAVFATIKTISEVNSKNLLNPARAQHEQTIIFW